MISQSPEFTLNIPDTDKPRVVIIGGGFGGINVLKQLSRGFQIILLDRYNYHTFQPLLYQVATAGLEPDSIAGPLRQIIHKKKDVYFRMLKVTGVNPEKGFVITSAGNLSYDHLIIATGAKMNYFNNDDMARYAFPLKQVTHALDLRSQIFQDLEKLEVLRRKLEVEEHMVFVVVGAGPTGVEVSGALAELKAHVLPRDYPDLDIQKIKIYLIEGENRILPTMSERSGQKAMKYLEKLGVKLLLNLHTTGYSGRIVELSNGQTIRADTLIWAAGVKGNIPEGFEGPIIQHGKLRINEFNQVLKDPDKGKYHENIFAIGDVALMITGNYPHGLPGVAQTAIQQGRQVAGNLNRLLSGKPLRTFRYRNKGVLATVGRNRAVGDLPGHIKISGMLGWMIWMAVHLFSLIGFRARIIVFANWIWNYFTYDRGIRLILRPSSKTDDLISRDMEQEMQESGN